jgi:hypothetical protein
MTTSAVRVGQVWKWSFGDIYLIAGIERNKPQSPEYVYGVDNNMDVALCFELSTGALYSFTSVGQDNWKLLIDVEPNR